MAKLIYKKVQSSTLIEVLIAMVIIVVVFVISMRIFTNVMASSVSVKSVKVEQELHNLYTKVQTEGVVPQTNLIIDGTIYSFTISPTSRTEVFNLQITAFYKDKLIGQVSCLYKVKSNEN
jgi:Tfp pilus assembly protein PilV